MAHVSPATESDVLAIAAQWLDAGHRVALATVVNASGSAPRQMGSHIAVRDDGAFAGSVSAGCVENAVIELAQTVIADGRQRSARFGISDGVLSTGLLCGGEIEILVEPFHRREILERILAARREGRMLVRALDVESGEEKLLDPERDTSPLGVTAAEAARNDTSRRVTVDGRNWFLSVYNTPWEIVVIGAVHIAQPLAALAQSAGYRVRVIDPRAAYATDERFPGMTLERDWPEQALARQPLSKRSALVALTHDTKIDDDGLLSAMRSDAFYIGALGSTRTHAKRIVRLSERGASAELLTRIHGPVGLSIGARAPAEIAIAILAELVQVRRMKPRLAGVILAAGTSSRMGKNKLLTRLGGKPLIRRAVDAAIEGELDPVIVVTGHQADALRAVLTDAKVTFVQNEDYAQGLSTSLRAGVAAVPADCNGAMILLGDMPDIDSGLVRRLAAAFNPTRGRGLVVATSGGERGHPVLWARQFFSEFENLQGDVGARPLMSAHSGNVFEIETGDRAPLTDIDTPEALLAHGQRG